MSYQEACLLREYSGMRRIADEAVALGNSLLAVPLEQGKGWVIQHNSSPYQTPEPLRGTYWSLADAKEALRRYNLGLLGPKKYNFKDYERTQITRGQM
jgi:hypothetical protein